MQKGEQAPFLGVFRECHRHKELTPCKATVASPQRNGDATVWSNAHFLEKVTGFAPPPKKMKAELQLIFRDRAGEFAAMLWKQGSHGNIDVSGTASSSVDSVMPFSPLEFDTFPMTLCSKPSTSGQSSSNDGRPPITGLELKTDSKAATENHNLFNLAGSVCDGSTTSVLSSYQLSHLLGFGTQTQRDALRHVQSTYESAELSCSDVPRAFLSSLNNSVSGTDAKNEICLTKDDCLSLAKCYEMNPAASVGSSSEVEFCHEPETSAKQETRDNTLAASGSRFGSVSFPAAHINSILEQRKEQCAEKPQFNASSSGSLSRSVPEQSASGKKDAFQSVVKEVSPNRVIYANTACIIPSCDDAGKVVQQKHRGKCEARPACVGKAQRVCDNTDLKRAHDNQKAKEASCSACCSPFVKGFEDSVMQKSGLSFSARNAKQRVGCPGTISTSMGDERGSLPNTTRTYDAKRNTKLCGTSLIVGSEFSSSSPPAVIMLSASDTSEPSATSVAVSIPAPESFNCTLSHAHKQNVLLQRATHLATDRWTTSSHEQLSVAECNWAKCVDKGAFNNSHAEISKHLNDHGTHSRDGLISSETTSMEIGTEASRSGLSTARESTSRVSGAITSKRNVTHFPNSSATSKRRGAIDAPRSSPMATDVAQLVQHQQQRLRKELTIIQTASYGHLHVVEAYPFDTSSLSASRSGDTGPRGSGLMPYQRPLQRDNASKCSPMSLNDVSLSPEALPTVSVSYNVDHSLNEGNSGKRKRIRPVSTDATTCSERPTSTEEFSHLPVPKVSNRPIYNSTSKNCSMANSYQFWESPKTALRKPCFATVGPESSTHSLVADVPPRCEEKGNTTVPLSLNKTSRLAVVAERKKVEPVVAQLSPQSTMPSLYHIRKKCDKSRMSSLKKKSPLVQDNSCESHTFPTLQKLPTSLTERDKLASDRFKDLLDFPQPNTAALGLSEVVWNHPNTYKAPDHARDVTIKQKTTLKRQGAVATPAAGVPSNTRCVSRIKNGESNQQRVAPESRSTSRKKAVQHAANLQQKHISSNPPVLAAADLPTMADGRKTASAAPRTASRTNINAAAASNETNSTLGVAAQPRETPRVPGLSFIRRGVMGRKNAVPAETTTMSGSAPSACRSSRSLATSLSRFMGRARDNGTKQNSYGGVTARNTSVSNACSTTANSGSKRELTQLNPSATIETPLVPTTSTVDSKRQSHGLFSEINFGTKGVYRCTRSNVTSRSANNAANAVPQELLRPPQRISSAGYRSCQQTATLERTLNSKQQNNPNPSIESITKVSSRNKEFRHESLTPLSTASHGSSVANYNASTCSITRRCFPLPPHRGVTARRA